MKRGISYIFITLFLLTSFPLLSENNLLKSDTENGELLLKDGFFSQIENQHITPQIDGGELTWNLNYEFLSELENKDFSISIRYITKLNAERLKKGFSKSEWSRIDNIDLHQTNFFLSDLEGDEEYIVQIGLVNAQEEFWSSELSFQPKRKWGRFDVFVLLGSLALFLYGMKIMSDGLQQATGKKLRNILGSITSNRFKGILTGLGITTLIQSSSVTTVMTVSFVNAGILTLVQAAGVIMGANIGTTVTAWLIDIFGFKVDIAPYTLIIFALGFPLFFAHSSKIKNWANVIVGFSLLFLGLGFLKDAVPEVSPDSGIVSFFVSINNIPYFSTIISVLFGAILTLIIQSSSATVALTMTLMVSGVIPFEVGAAMVLGENIGTTITAELAATVGNVHAKRAARIHSSFNVFGVIWILLVFPFFLKLVAFITEYISGGNPIENPNLYGSTGLAVLHTIFNLTNTLMMIWFVPYLVRFAERTVRSRGKSDEQFQLEYIGTGKGMKTPELSILEVKKELARFGEITSRISSFTRDLILEPNRKNQQKIIKRIQKYEGITDEVEIEITNYLNKMSGRNVAENLAVRINGMNRISSNLERIGDVFYQISKMIEKKNEEKIVFTELQTTRLLDILDLLDEAFDVMKLNLNKHSEEVTLVEAQKVEQKIKRKRDEIRHEYYSKMLTENNGGLSVELIYNNIFNSLVRISDHIMNVSEGIVGKL